MKSRRLIWQILPPLLVVVLGTVVAAVWYASHAVREFHYAETERKLLAAARLVNAHLKEKGVPLESGGVDKVCDALGRASGYRVTVILPGGRVAVISVGDGEGPDRVELAVKTTLAHPLLDVDYKGASGALIHIIGGEDMTLGEANEIGEKLTAELDTQATITWGARVDPRLTDKLEVIAIVTGVKSPNILGAGTTLEKIGDSSYYTTEVDNLDIKGV